MKFDWDESNERHLARHGVRKIEAEESLVDPLGQFLEETVVGEESRYRYIGLTSQGRLLVVVFTLRAGKVRPVTAFDSGRRLARLYGHGVS